MTCDESVLSSKHGCTCAINRADNLVGQINSSSHRTEGGEQTTQTGRWSVLRMCAAHFRCLNWSDTRGSRLQRSRRNLVKLVFVSLFLIYQIHNSVSNPVIQWVTWFPARSSHALPPVWSSVCVGQYTLHIIQIRIDCLGLSRSV